LGDVPDDQWSRKPEQHNEKRGAKVKITDVRSYILKTGSVFVQAFTDEGLTGIGECSPMNAMVVAHFVYAALKPLIVGENPLEIDRLWHKMPFRTYQLGVQGVQLEAMWRIDVALWHILGQATGLPICVLRGGRYRDRVQVYASIGGRGAHDAWRDGPEGGALSETGHHSL